MTPIIYFSFFFSEHFRPVGTKENDVRAANYMHPFSNTKMMHFDYVFSEDFWS